MRIFRWPSFFVLLLCFGCQAPLPKLEGIDLQRWQQDKNACHHQRADMCDAIDHEKEKLLSLKQMEVVELLGHPDQNELYSRNQKFFYYFIDPAPTCPGGDSSAAKLVLRFNAIGLVNEVAIE